MNPSGCCGILLAAGRSVRFGSDKLLHPLADGTPLGLVSALHIREAMSRLLAIVDVGNEALRQLFERHSIPVLSVSTAAAGMGASLAAGVAATADAAGWLVGLADMPFVRPQTIVRVSQAIEGGAPLAAPCHQGRRGHPVGFAYRFGDSLKQLSGDEGARRLLAAHAAELRLIDCDDPGVLRDIDFPDDLTA